MLLVISPAKNLDFESAMPIVNASQPSLLNESIELMKSCVDLTPQQLSSLMGISDKLAGLNAARFTQWHVPFTDDNARPAVFAFNGDVYTGLDAYSLEPQDIEFAQQHLRILSGLYGVLKPLDLMQPYRLEMGTKLANERGTNLYQFWGDIITDNINQAVSAQGDEILINLASTEYFKSVKKKQLKATIITPAFKDWKNGQYKMISFYAKKARGLMARYIIENKIESVDDLLKFDIDGYGYNKDMSTKDVPVFTRKAI